MENNKFSPLHETTTSANVEKKKRDFKISFPYFNVNYPMIKVINAFFLLICLTNPYLVGFGLRWGVDQFKAGWQEQPTCFTASPRLVGIAKSIPFHLKITCAPSGE